MMMYWQIRSFSEAATPHRETKSNCLYSFRTKDGLAEVHSVGGSVDWQASVGEENREARLILGAHDPCLRLLGSTSGVLFYGVQGP
jgi:hypothetical protein